MRYGVAAALMILSTFGCAPQLEVDLTAERAALREAMEAYHEAASTKDAQTVVSMYDNDAMMIPPNAERVEGIEGVRTYRFGFIENASVELDFEAMRIEIAPGGDMAWTLAVANASFEGPDGEPGSDRIRDFHVWKKQADGSWKVEVDIWNSGPPVP